MCPTVSELWCFTLSWLYDALKSEKAMETLRKHWVVYVSALHFGHDDMKALFLRFNICETTTVSRALNLAG